ncbi:voltage-dependent calcium channel beta subunit-associated regulatory protein [Anarrhichthys ocellatus]|uniref:voltage-dependent calcium channel beta subunit-associated regulatory protein n=1 Tax=Anarrhichthys ocellatus TaxID=433405 RepID=UPI0012ECFDD9|nr:voltage-dependent calcium channel beta subunit-associated regulatory protein-like [Anarrhichthys ocellatus]XP_031724290.1 voltage-dependent calcium channel beta subunit-associated regulatory protein-like [Anarrhichthys ocellatus]XP_031724292.1 voltage-dependent calcium channel beta subunit-associated regulatory protein-like [Anarrhichthys ocellatus]XP_031724293.1 voltage-dependent calcium channel beta subunit-associated regulatory protein-like [Anarrhichthys ocellatus]XP_031724294.1 voltage-
MSNESTVWNILPENSTEIPFVAEEQQDGYVLLLVILSVFLVGTVIFITVFLIAYRRCCRGGPCLASASDDPEKTNTTYVEESQPTHEITIRVDESDCLSMASSRNQETERFLSTGTMGRRVSFNEAALFDHGKKAQEKEKGRRYTLTEGDFHHLKNARLTHLHIPPPGLKIVTIHECDSAENSITMTARPVTKSALSIFQPMLCPLPQTALTSLSVNPSCALPGDALNSVVDTGFSGNTIALGTKEPISSSIEMMGAGPRGRGSSISVGEGAAVRSGGAPHAGGGAGSQGPVLQFFTKLRRHASLEGASPYFKIKKWKLDSSQRASSLDTRGSPTRRQFQRQRAASESMDQDDNDARHIDLIQYFARTQDTAYCPSHPSTRLLSTPSTPPPSLGRVEVEVMVEPSCSHGGPGVIGLSPDPQDEALSLARRDGADPPDPQDPHTLYQDLWSLRATLEQYAASDQSSNNDRNSVCSDAESVCSLGGCKETERGGLPSYQSQDLGDEAEGGEDDKDISMYMDERLQAKEGRKRKQESTESERGGSDAETGTRKLLQMDSGYASIDAPSRGPEDLRLFGSGSGSPKDRTAHEKRHHFTNTGRTGTIESFESHFLEEELEDELLLGASGGVSIETGAGSLSWVPYGQMLTPREAAQPSPQPLALHRRDYSIDEKTDALFHEFLRHDPQFDQQESPLKKHRSRIHLRKQWQRHKQWSDPGVRHFQSSFDRLRAPLRRGESVNYPLDTSYHSTLPRIVSAPDEETSEGTGSTPDTPKVEPTTAKTGGEDGEQGVSVRDAEDNTSSSPLHLHPSGEHLDPQEDSRQPALPPEPPDERSPPQPPDSSGYGPQTITAELTDKLTANLDDRLYTGLRRTKDTDAECVTVTAARASPDHSPV